jgi:glycosyltransferase involved in cell wall biosynthesis
MQIITRMNIGGPAYHVTLLSGRMDPMRYTTLLVHGELGPGEASFDDLAEQEGCDVAVVPSLGPQVRPVADLRSVVELVRIVRRLRPDIVHTHTTKAGALGRLAASLAVRPRPVIIHTHHGQVLEGRFGPLMTSCYRVIERRLARVSDCQVGVSQTTVEDLVRLGIAPREACRVIPLALDLERFSNVTPAAGIDFRESVGAGHDDVLLTCVCRLVPLKRVDFLLRVIARLRESHPTVRLAVVGDGEHRPALERLTDELRLRDRVRFVGYMTDVAPVAAATDVAVLSSDSREGTPVALIEAAAAGVPAVATTIGGVGEVVGPDAGILVPPGDEAAFAAAVAQLADDPALRARMGRNARSHVREHFALERQLEEIDALYQDLVANGGRSRRRPHDGSLPRRGPGAASRTG